MPVSSKSSAIELFPHQSEAIAWLKNRKTALLALDMGLGKTGIALSAAKHSRVTSILVLCPAIACSNWEREFKKWECEIPRKILSYNMAPKLGTDEKFDLLILDEVHFLKNIQAQRTRLVFGKAGIVRRVNRVWALTGTPAPNHAGELWPILFTFGATKLSYQDFCRKFCTGRKMKIGQKTVYQITGTNTMAKKDLSDMLEKVMLRKTQGEVLKTLPAINFETITIPGGKVDWEREPAFAKFAVPSDRSKELFDMLVKERDILEHVIKTARNFDDKAKALTALEQGCANLRKWIGLQKVEPIVTLVTDELENNLYEKIVIFAHHRSVCEGLQRGLNKFNAAILYGGTTNEKRFAAIDKFQKFSSYRVLICNILTASTAINLTAANQVLFVEQDWVPANNLQAAKRCHRIGQERPVFVRFATISGSIDEQITETIERKMRELATFIRSDVPPPPKINPLDRLIEVPEKSFEEFTPVDLSTVDKVAPSSLDFDSLCQ